MFNKKNKIVEKINRMLDEKNVVQCMLDKPDWCPHSSDCTTLRCMQDKVCVGKLLKLDPHNGDFNTHGFCLNGASDSRGVFDLRINTTDIYIFRLAFDAIKKQETPEVKE